MATAHANRQIRTHTKPKRQFAYKTNNNNNKPHKNSPNLNPSLFAPTCSFCNSCSQTFYLIPIPLTHLPSLTHSLNISSTQRGLLVRTAQTSESSFPAALSAGHLVMIFFVWNTSKQGNPGLLYALNAVLVQGARGASRWVKSWGTRNREVPELLLPPPQSRDLLPKVSEVSRVSPLCGHVSCVHQHLPKPGLSLIPCCALWEYCG